MTLAPEEEMRLVALQLAVTSFGNNPSEEAIGDHYLARAARFYHFITTGEIIAAPTIVNGAEVK